MPKVPIESIKFVKELYPREYFDEATVNQYLQANVDDLPPIKVTKDMTLIDGRHRLEVFKRLRKEEVEVEILDVPKDRILYEAIRLNSAHGKQLTNLDKMSCAKRLHDQGCTEEQIVKALSVSWSYVSKWLSQTVRDERERKRQQARELSQQGLSTREIGEKLGLGHATVIEYLRVETVRKLQPVEIRPPTYQDEMTKLLDKYLHCAPISENEMRKLEPVLKAKTAEFDEVPKNLKVYNLWQFMKQEDKRSSDFPRADAYDLRQNILYYYTRPFNLVVDPMDSAGSTFDACLSMYRRCLAYDINPVRDETKEWDIMQGYPPEVGGHWKPDLIFLEMPHFKRMREQYGDRRISSLTESEFLQFMSQLAQDTFKVLAPQGVAALLVRDCVNFEDDSKSMFAADFACQFEQAGFMPIDHIAVPLPTEQKMAREEAWARQRRRLLEISRDIFVFKKPQQGKGESAVAKTLLGVSAAVP